jgi:hypothetical protein
MIKLDRDTLVELWKSDETISEMAQRLNVKRNDLTNAFRKLKAAGHLPPGDRPRSRASYHRGEHQGDGRPRDSGDMLDALMRAHPERIKCKRPSDRTALTA